MAHLITHTFSSNKEMHGDIGATPSPRRFKIKKPSVCPVGKTLPFSPISM
jgi:hypothetical protein